MNLGEYQKCPVCEGRGIVSNDFYNTYPYGITSSQAPIECHSCKGRGIILRPKPQPTNSDGGK